MYTAVHTFISSTQNKAILVVFGTWGSMRRSLDADCKVSISFSFLINKIKKRLEWHEAAWIPGLGGTLDQGLSLPS